MEKKTAIELYGEDIRRLTEEGYSCDQIGKKLGVSRQRIWKLRKRFYPEAKPKWPNDSQTAKIFGISVSTLKNLRERDLIHPLMVGHFYRYDDNAQEEIKKVRNRSCRICGSPIPPRHWALCLKCSAQIKDPKLRLALPGEREKHNIAMRNWKKRHTEQVSHFP